MQPSQFDRWNVVTWLSSHHSFTPSSSHTRRKWRNVQGAERGGTWWCGLCLIGEKTSYIMASWSCFFFLFYCLISCILHKKVLSAPLCRLCRLMQLPSNIESRSILCGVQHQTVSGMLLTGAALLSVEILSRMTKLAMMELPSASGAELLSQGSPPIFIEGPESFWERKRLWGRPLK